MDVVAIKLLCFQGHKMDSIKTITSANKNMLPTPLPLERVKSGFRFSKVNPVQNSKFILLNLLLVTNDSSYHPLTMESTCLLTQLEKFHLPHL